MNKDSAPSQYGQWLRATTFNLMEIGDKREGGKGNKPIKYPQNSREGQSSRIPMTKQMAQLHIDEELLESTTEQQTENPSPDINSADKGKKIVQLELVHQEDTNDI